MFLPLVLVIDRPFMSTQLAFGGVLRFDRPYTVLRFRSRFCCGRRARHTAGLNKDAVPPLTTE